MHQPRVIDHWMVTKAKAGKTESEMRCDAQNSAVAQSSQDASAHIPAREIEISIQRFSQSNSAHGRRKGRLSILLRGCSKSGVDPRSQKTTTIVELRQAFECSIV